MMKKWLALAVFMARPAYAGPSIIEYGGVSGTSTGGGGLPDGGSPGVSSVWTTAYDCSFSTTDGGGSYTLPQDAGVTICGQTWVNGNSFYTTSYTALTPTGVAFTPSQIAGYSGGAANSVTMPNIRLTLANVIPNIAATTAIRVWVYWTAANVTANFDAAIAAIERDPSPTTLGTEGISVIFSSTVNFAGQYITTAGSSVSSVNTANAPYTGGLAAFNVMVLTSTGLGNTSYEGDLGNYSSGWPSPSSLNEIFLAGPYVGPSAPSAQYPYTGSAGVVAPPPTAYDLIIGCQRAGSATALVCTAARVRIEYHP